ncbi:MAG: hypothetical protein J2P48_21275 [Alphaproteobacteria bacterium]|nr:hypothetical protein [Alphaproteobacteria bacterium]
MRPESTDDLLDISNAISLLWRLEQDGVDVGARWSELADRSQTHIDDHLLTFGDVHYLTRRWAHRRRIMPRREPVALRGAKCGERGGGGRRPLGIGASGSVVATRRSQRGVSRAIGGARKLWRIGGSHAQRDLFEQMLIASALRAGKLQAEILLNEWATRCLGVGDI